MSDYPMLISNKLHSFRNFIWQIYDFSVHWSTRTVNILFNLVIFRSVYRGKLLILHAEKEALPCADPLPRKEYQRNTAKK